MWQDDYDLRLVLECLLTFTGCSKEVEAVAVDTATVSTEYVSEESTVVDVVVDVPEETFAHDEITSQDVSDVIAAQLCYDSSVIEYACNAVQVFLKDNPVVTMWIGAYSFKTGITEVYEDGEYSHLDSIELYMISHEEIGRYAEIVDSDTFSALLLSLSMR